MSRRGAILQDYGGRFEPMTFEGQLTGARIAASATENRAQQETAKQTAKQKEGKDALDFIQGIKGNPVGETTLDVIDTDQIEKLKSDLTKKYLSGASFTDIKIEAGQRLPVIAKGSMIGKNEFSKITEAQKGILKKYPKANAEASRNIMGKEMLNNLIEYNEDGTVKGYKEPSLINPNKDYSAPLFDPERMDEWLPETEEALVSNIQKTRGLVDINDKLKVINSRGGYEDEGYKGQISIYHRPTVDEDGKITGIQLDSETVTLGKNDDGTANIIQVMPKEKYDVFRGDEESASQFDRKVYNHLKKELGINAKSLDPQALDIYSRNYALNLLEKSKLHGGSYNRYKIEKADPVKNITNNNIRVGGAKEVDINDLYGRIGKKIDAEIEKGFTATRFNSLGNDEQAAVKQAVENAGYALLEGGGNIYLSKDGDEYKIYKAEDGKLLPKNAGNEIATLSFVGTNLPKQPNTATKVEVVKQGEANRSGKATAKTFNVINPNTGEVIMKGVDEAAANKAKAKGYKVQ